MDFLTISGWIFGLVSFIFGLIQLIQKNKYKKQLVNNVNQKQNVKKKSKGYQAGRDITVN